MEYDPSDWIAFLAGPVPTHRDQRAVAYVAEIPEAAPAGFMGAAGDSVDAMQKQVRLLTAIVKNRARLRR